MHVYIYTYKHIDIYTCTLIAGLPSEVVVLLASMSLLWRFS